MPSTRKQKAKERRSRQLEMLSDVENVDIMLGSYSRDEDNNASGLTDSITQIWTPGLVGHNKVQM